MTEKFTNTKSDAELYLSITKKDKQSFGHLYTQYSSLVYGLALNSLRSQPYATDVVQLTFVKVWNRIDLFKTQKISLKLWIIQNMILATQEFLSSKNIKYEFRMNHFPDFSFDLIEEQDQSLITSELQILTIPAL